MDYDITPYDDSTPRGLLEHAKKLNGKTFADVLHVKRTDLSLEKTTKITQLQCFSLKRRPKSLSRGVIPTLSASAH